ncbi:MAG: hypothetical protein AAF125_24895 [Chloroflexota bacterium]
MGDKPKRDSAPADYVRLHQRRVSRMGRAIDWLHNVYPMGYLATAIGLGLSFFVTLTLDMPQVGQVVVVTSALIGIVSGMGMFLAWLLGLLMAFEHIIHRAERIELPRRNKKKKG